MKKLFFTSLLALIVLTACKTVGPTAEYPYDGKWTGRAESAVQMADCVGADLTIEVVENKFSGTARNDQGVKYDVLGTVDDEGNISAGFVVGGKEVVDIEGLFTEDKALGRWDAGGGCNGSYSLSR